MRIELSEATGSETTYWDDVTVTPSTVSGDPGTSFRPTYNLATNRFATLPGGTPSLTATAVCWPTASMSTRGMPTGHNMSINNNAAIVAYNALDRWVERANSAGHTQAMYAPDGNLLAVTNGQTLVHGYLAMPGGAMAHYTASGLAEYWHPD